MRRLYIQIYVALLMVILAFALLLAGIVWHLDHKAVEKDWATEITLFADAIIPPTDASQERLEAWARALAKPFDLDITIYNAERVPLVQLGDPAPPLPTTRETQWISDGFRHRAAGAIALSDGRWIVLKGERPQRDRSFVRLLGAIGLLAIAIGLAAYPLTRRLTRRLESLKSHVEALGQGHLDARVPVEGRDEIAELARAFNLTADRIAGLVDDKRRLLAHTSHELRTPLARIRVALELLRENPRPELLARVDRDIEELDELIGELLVSSRMDAPEQSLSTEPVDLLALCAEEAARLGGIEVGGIAVLVEGDPRLLRRLIRNLLQNAVRHGERPVDVLVRVGQPSASASASPSPSPSPFPSPFPSPAPSPAPSDPALDLEPSTVQLIVSDCGPGVPESERERIFEPFYRREGEASAEGGIGLGLALVRQIALRHGGKIICAPRQDGGTRFILSIPLRPAEEDAPETADA